MTEDGQREPRLGNLVLVFVEAFPFSLEGGYAVVMERRPRRYVDEKQKNLLWRPVELRIKLISIYRPARSVVNRFNSDRFN
jgi:hypothetical protein